MIFSNGPMSASQKGCTQPPKRKPLDGSSSGPPGACMTPSSERKTAPVSLRIDRLPFDCCLNRGDVDLLHRHHCLEGALRGVSALVEGIDQHARRDLPGEAPLVLAPAALAFLTAVLGDGVPVTVGFRLILGVDAETDRLIGSEVGAAVETHEALAEEGEVDGQLVPLLASRKVRRRLVRRPDVGLGEDRRVEFGGLARLTFVEPQASRELVTHAFLLIDQILRRRRTRVSPGPLTAAYKRPATKMK